MDFWQQVLTPGTFKFRVPVEHPTSAVTYFEEFQAAFFMTNSVTIIAAPYNPSSLDLEIFKIEMLNFGTDLFTKTTHPKLQSEIYLKMKLTPSYAVTNPFS